MLIANASGSELQQQQLRYRNKVARVEATNHHNRKLKDRNLGSPAILPNEYVIILDETKFFNNNNNSNNRYTDTANEEEMIRSIFIKEFGAALSMGNKTSHTNHIKIDRVFRNVFIGIVIKANSHMIHPEQFLSLLQSLVQDDRIKYIEPVRYFYHHFVYIYKKSRINSFFLFLRRGRFFNFFSSQCT